MAKLLVHMNRTTDTTYEASWDLKQLCERQTHQVASCAGSTQQHWPFPENRIALGYAYLFTHPGNPTIFWDHYFNSPCRDTIDQLISLRKRHGLNAKSSVEILAAEHDFYVARIDNK